MNLMNSDGWTRWPARIVGSALAFALVVSALTSGTDSVSARKRASPKLVQDFGVSGSIAIPDGGQSAPSAIVVSGFDTEVADINISLNNLTHAQVGDVDALLVGPGGQTALFLSDVGTSANNVNLTLDDQATNQVSSFNPLGNGVFQPTNFQSGDFFSPPAPASPPSGSELGVFNSTDPNGTWTLHIRDDSSGTGGGNLAGGWSLRITSANGVPNAAPESFSVKAGKTLNELGGVLDNDDDPDDDFLTAILAGPPAKGQVTLEAGGSFTYKAKKTAKGKDSFTYLAQDPGGLSDLETVTITIKKAKKKKGKR